MRYASFCDGIGAAHVAWKPLGWTPVYRSEIEPFCDAVVDARHPGIVQLGDMNKITEAQLDAQGQIDVLVAGTPCQSFSVAGLRKGLADARGNLALRFLAIAGHVRPRWIVWENVPGVLSARSRRAKKPRRPTHDVPKGTEEVVTEELDVVESHAFACFLSGLSELGYGWSYRVLDALHVGGCPLHVDEFSIGPVPQRRRRVFVVARLGDWRPAAAVLFERALLSGDLETRKAKGKDAAYAVRTSAARGMQDGADNLAIEEKGQTTAHGLTTRSAGSTGGHAGMDQLLLDVTAAELERTKAFSLFPGGDAGMLQGREIDRSPTLDRHGGNPHRAQGGTVVAQSFHQRTGKLNEDEALTLCQGSVCGNARPSIITHSHALTRGMGDTSEYGTGRGVPIVTAYHQFVGNAGVGTTGDESHTLAAGRRNEKLVTSEFVPPHADPLVVGEQKTYTHAGTGNFRTRNVVALRHDAASRSGKAAKKGHDPSFSIFDDVSPTMDANRPHFVAAQSSQSGLRSSEHARPVRSSAPGGEAGGTIVLPQARARRLTPRECERLMGFPDDYTRIRDWANWSEKDAREYAEYWAMSPKKIMRARFAKDSPRYKSLGNSMATTVMRWIGTRITFVDELVGPGIPLVFPKV